MLTFSTELDTIIHHVPYRLCPQIVMQITSGWNQSHPCHQNVTYTEGHPWMCMVVLFKSRLLKKNKFTQHYLFRLVTQHQHIVKTATVLNDTLYLCIMQLDIKFPKNRDFPHRKALNLYHKGFPHRTAQSFDTKSFE